MPEISVPERFEDEYPEAAALMMRVYAVGGKFKQPNNRFVTLPKLPPIHVERNVQCPCGSGKKAKKCHPAWVE